MNIQTAKKEVVAVVTGSSSGIGFETSLLLPMLQCGILLNPTKLLS
jgi:NADP-dependent 3-hydroxy acid dehydrogenase YdfG